MMRIALLAADYELGRYAHSLSVLEDMEWVGYCLVGGKETSAGPESLPAGKLPRSYSSPQQMAGDADLVVVGGRPEQRFDFISNLLRRGKCVWSDWPLSTASAKIRKLAALAEEARVCNQVAHPGRKHPLWLAALPFLDRTGVVRTELSDPDCPGMEQAMDEVLFPFLDRVLSIDGTQVRKVKARKLKTAVPEKFSAQVEIEFCSGLLAEFWMGNVLSEKIGKMRCMTAESVVDLDFVTSELSLQDTCKGGGKRKIKVEPCRESASDAFLTRDLQCFTRACRNGEEGNLNFAESGRVQEILFQIRHILL